MSKENLFLYFINIKMLFSKLILKLHLNKKLYKYLSISNETIYQDCFKRYIASIGSIENKFENKAFEYFHMDCTDENSENFFSKRNFCKYIIENFKLNTTYSILVKVADIEFSVFRMVGPQIGLVIGSSHDKEYYEKLFIDILIEIRELLIRYKEDIEEITSVEFMYTTIYAPPYLKLRNVNKIKLPRGIIKNKDFKLNFSDSLFPLTMDKRYYGLKVDDFYEWHIDRIKDVNDRRKIYGEKGDLVNFSEFFYYQKDVRGNLNKIIKMPESSYNMMIAIDKKSKNKEIKYVFSHSTGLLLEKVIDEIVSFNTFKRTIGNNTITICDEKVIKSELNFKLPPIKPIIKPLAGEIDTNFGSFDIETYINLDGITKVYALGFFTEKEENPNLFWIEDYQNSDDLVLSCINNMLRLKYDKYRFYCHNFGGYDFLFIYKILVDYNLKYKKIHGKEYYKIDIIARNEDIIKMKVRIVNPNTVNAKKPTWLTISFVDSYNLLSDKLSKLATDFETDTVKSMFPYSFVNENNFGYVGEKPNINYYEFKYMKKEEKKEFFNMYNNINEEKWNLKEESLKYLTNDLKALYEIMDIFSLKIFLDFNVDITSSITISRLALNIFNKRYYKVDNEQSLLPLIKNHEIFQFIRSGYYGGITEVYKPYGRNLLYLDVNSLYPYASINKPLPGLFCTFIEDYTGKGLCLNKLFGFFYAKVTTTNSYLGLLPYRTSTGIIFPNGEFEGVWSSEELKFAEENGYKIKVIKGYNFNKNYNIFEKYVTDLYKNKSESKGAKRYIYKSLLNNLIGRYAINIYKPITEIVNKDLRDKIASTKIILNQHKINDDTYYLTYDPNISEDICTNHGLDYLKVLKSNYNKTENIQYYDNLSITTSAMITSYARIEMNKYKLDLLNKGINIFYSDTDSLVIDNTKDINYLLGSELGKFKLEYEVEEGYFISNKTYCLCIKDKEPIIKAKGVISQSLNKESFIKLYRNNKYVRAEKKSSIKNYTEGYVNIISDEIDIHSDSYGKRTKLYNSNDTWIDTKPLTIKSNLENKTFDILNNYDSYTKKDPPNINNIYLLLFKKLHFFKTIYIYTIIKYIIFIIILIILLSIFIDNCIILINMLENIYICFYSKVSTFVKSIIHYKQIIYSIKYSINTKYTIYDINTIYLKINYFSYHTLPLTYNIHLNNLNLNTLNLNNQVHYQILMNNLHKYYIIQDIIELLNKYKDINNLNLEELEKFTSLLNEHFYKLKQFNNPIMNHIIINILEESNYIKSNKELIDLLENLAYENNHLLVKIKSKLQALPPLSPLSPIKIRY